MSAYPINPNLRFVRGTKGGKIRMATVAWYEFAPTAATVASVLAATLLAEVGTTVVTTGITNPDVPRVVSVKGNAASVVGTVTIDGFDANGTPITEELVLNGVTTVVGTKAFARVRRVVLPVRAVAANSVSVGVGVKLGLWHALLADVRLKTLFDGADDAGTLAIDVDKVCKNLFTPAGTLDGVKVLRILYLV